MGDFRKKKKNNGAEWADLRTEKRKKKKLHESGMACLLSIKRNPKPVDRIQMLTMGTLGGSALGQQTLW